jgi:hypothetical protein
MSLEKMTDQAIAEELARQSDIQKRHKPESAMWIQAARIIHNLASEQARRQRAALKPVRP